METTLQNIGEVGGRASLLSPGTVSDFHMPQLLISVVSHLTQVLLSAAGDKIPFIWKYSNSSKRSKVYESIIDSLIT